MFGPPVVAPVVAPLNPIAYEPGPPSPSAPRAPSHRESHHSATR